MPGFPFRTIEECKGALGSKRVLVRAECNAPIEGGMIDDDFRLRKALRTITFLKEEGAKVIVIAHIEGDETDSLEVVYEWFRKHVPLAFCRDYKSAEGKKMLDEMKSGDIVLLENLRVHEGEKKNDPEFARSLAAHAEMYVNDAFSVSHRTHASIVGIPRLLPSYAGLQFADEFRHLGKAFNPEHPFLFVLGGAKFETKIPLVRKFLPHADTIFLGGAIPNVLWKAKGVDVARSLVPEKEIDVADLLTASNVIVPEDVICEEDASHGVCNPYRMPRESIMRDVGPESVKKLSEIAARARFVLWNGPLGDYEEGYESSTASFAYKLAKLDDVDVVIGGGDTGAVVLKHLKEEDFSFVSTAGGAMLEFLSTETLPGIKALEESNR